MFVILVGNIATGKSTFCKNLKKNNRYIVCPDNFSGNKQDIQKKIINEIEYGIKNYKHVILDAPSLTKKHRSKLLYFARNNHRTIVFNFGAGNANSLKRRINENPEVSESEWTDIHNKNLTDYEEPSIDEGFDRIIKVNNNK